MPTAPTILVIEDSRFFAKQIVSGLEERLPVNVVLAESLAQAQEIISRSQTDFFLALVDIVLPDSQNGEILDLVLANGIPSIVFSSIYSPDVRQHMLDKRIIDYVIKNTPSSLSYLFSLVEQIYRNRQIKVLLVDDSRAARSYMRSMLENYQLQVVEAASGEEGLNKLDEDASISLVISDHYMQGMDGVEMVRRIREKYDLDRLAVIGISSSGDHELSARFLKHGANDFISKPFQREEFFCRLMQNLRMVEMVSRLKFAATRDFLTGLHNRRYFFEQGDKLLQRMKQGKLTLTSVMLDVDFFKKVNDTYGHDGGDVVLKAVAGVLDQHRRPTDLLARLGGEEFALLCVDLSAEQAFHHVDGIRQALAATRIEFGDKVIPVTASFGICPHPRDTVDKLLEGADMMLYQAKQNGRNRVEMLDA